MQTRRTPLSQFPILPRYLETQSPQLQSSPLGLATIRPLTSADDQCNLKGKWAESVVCGSEDGEQHSKLAASGKCEHSPQVKHMKKLAQGKGKVDEEMKWNGKMHTVYLSASTSSFQFANQPNNQIPKPHLSQFVLQVTDFCLIITCICSRRMQPSFEAIRNFSKAGGNSKSKRTRANKTSSQQSGSTTTLQQRIRSKGRNDSLQSANKLKGFLQFKIMMLYHDFLQRISSPQHLLVSSSSSRQLPSNLISAQILNNYYSADCLDGMKSDKQEEKQPKAVNNPPAILFRENMKRKSKENEPNQKIRQEISIQQCNIIHPPIAQKRRYLILRTNLFQLPLMTQSPLQSQPAVAKLSAVPVDFILCAQPQTLQQTQNSPNNKTGNTMSTERDGKSRPTSSFQYNEVKNIENYYFNDVKNQNCTPTNPKIKPQMKKIKSDVVICSSLIDAVPPTNSFNYSLIHQLPAELTPRSNTDQNGQCQSGGGNYLMEQSLVNAIQTQQDVKTSKDMKKKVVQKEKKREGEGGGEGQKQPNPKPQIRLTILQPPNKIITPQVNYDNSYFRKIKSMPKLNFVVRQPPHRFVSFQQVIPYNQQRFHYHQQNTQIPPPHHSPNSAHLPHSHHSPHSLNSPPHSYSNLVHMHKPSNAMIYSSPAKMIVTHQSPPSPQKYLPQNYPQQSRPVTAQPLPNHVFYAQNQGKVHIQAKQLPIKLPTSPRFVNNSPQHFQNAQFQIRREPGNMHKTSPNCQVVSTKPHTPQFGQPSYSVMQSQSNYPPVSQYFVVQSNPVSNRNSRESVKMKQQQRERVRPKSMNEKILVTLRRQK